LGNPIAMVREKKKKYLWGTFIVITKTPEYPGVWEHEGPCPSYSLIRYLDHFISGGLAFDNAHGGFGDTVFFAQEFYELSVGLAVRRGRGEFYFKYILNYALNSNARGAGLHFNLHGYTPL
jgi:hypothetical protein